MTVQTRNSVPSAVARPDLVLTRVLDAPPRLVFQAWTDPRRLAQWWGPKGFTNPVCEVDPRPDGAIRILMTAPDGTEYPMDGVFREIVEPTRLSFTCKAHVDDSGLPSLEVLNMVTFEEVDGKTLLTLTARVIHAGPGAAQAVAGMEQGWSESLDRLEAQSWTHS